MACVWLVFVSAYYNILPVEGYRKVNLKTVVTADPAAAFSRATIALVGVTRFALHYAQISSRILYHDLLGTNVP